MNSQPTGRRGWVYEVFTSIQGEGLYCGQLQTFVRLAGCNLECAYCDTPAARCAAPEHCLVERAPGLQSFLEIPNPIESGAIVDVCARLRTKVVSITGGEPLLQPDFLADVASGLRAIGRGVHLETNGTLHDGLRRVIEFVEVIAMDVKLPSAARVGDLWDEHARFLAVASRAEVFVKAVVSSDTTEAEIGRCAGMIADVDPSIPLVIQPVTSEQAVSPRLLMKLQEVALDRLDDVRVIPQCHKVMGLP